MTESIWWMWAVLAVVFVIGEMFTAGFFLLWFGVGAGAAAGLAWLGPSLPWQIGAFAATSFAGVVVSRPLADRFTRPQPPGIGADRFTGQEGVVLEAIDNARNTGLVRLNRDEWRAESAAGGDILAGARVRVIAVVGAHVRVEEISEGESNG